MKLFNYDSPFWSFMSRLADLIILNLLWIVFCIPVVTIGASTTAMYRVTLNMVRGEGSGVVRMFWDAFRLNLKQAVLIFLILLIPVLLVVYEFWMYLSGAVGQSMWLGLVFCCPSLILALVLAYVYPLLAQFDNSIKNTLKKRLSACHRLAPLLPGDGGAQPPARGALPVCHQLLLPDSDLLGPDRRRAGRLRKQLAAAEGLQKEFRSRLIVKNYRRTRKRVRR